MQSAMVTLDKILRKYTPDPFVIAILITFAVGLIATSLTSSSPVEVVDAWGGGFWKLLMFTMQMVMILIGGYVVASSPPVSAAIQWCCGFVKTEVTAVIVATLVGAFAAWLNWGFGLVAGALTAVELGRRLPFANYRLLVASTYSGFILWHGGLSGSIPLMVATEGNFAQEWVGRAIPVSETLFSPFNIAAVVGLFILLPLTNVLLGKSSDPQTEAVRITASVEPASAEDGAALDKHWWIPLGLVMFGSVYLLMLVKQDRFRLDLNSMNFIFLFLGLTLHLKTKSFLSSVNDAAGKVGPIIIQYPLYAGIMGIMKDTGLATMISDGFVSLANQKTLNLFVFYSAGLVNLFVPSGGGQWAVQAPVVTQAATALGTDMSTTIMAVAWGDAWTNLAQPFWTLPVLALAGLGAKDIFGFTLVSLIVSGAYLSLLLLIF